jgi:OPT family oligopeptide transporter
VFLAIPMKRQMINREKLPFPTGMAAATALRSLYSEGKDAVRKAYALIASLAGGIVVGILKAPEGAIVRLDHVLDKIHMRLPELLPTAGYWQINGRQLIGFGFEPSVLLIGAGMLIGVRVCLSMLAGALLLYLVIGPWVISMDAANAMIEGYHFSIPVVGGGTVYHLFRWAIWGGTAVMVFSSLATLALQWKTVARSIKILRGGQAVQPSEVDRRMKSIEVPLSWLVAGLIPASIGLLAVQYFAFQISLWLGLIAVGMSFFLSLVACRATGETDTTPVSAMGKVMQLLFAALSPGNITHNLASAGVTANSAAASADFLTELKSGYMLGANPRKQFLAQFIGVFFGTLAIVPAWYLMVPNKAVLEAYNPPSTNVWRAVAEVLAGGGLDMLPMSARLAIVIGALVGVAIPLLENFLPRCRPYLPSAMGLGLSWIFSYSNSQAFAIGSVGVWLWTRMNKRSADDYAVPVASGLIAGESLAAALVAIIATLIGILHLQ